MATMRGSIGEDLLPLKYFDAIQPLPTLIVEWIARRR
jgi:hypothetical protein